jgi:hypothetical protein
MPKPKPTLSILCTALSPLPQADWGDMAKVDVILLNDTQKTDDILKTVQTSTSDWIVVAPDAATPEDLRALWQAAKHESFAEFPVMAMGREIRHPSLVSRGLSCLLGVLRRTFLGDRVGSGQMILMARRDFESLPPYHGVLDFVSVLARYGGIRVVSVPVSFQEPPLSPCKAAKLFADLWGTFWLKERWIFPPRQGTPPQL